jgi:hypothetical protein|eukprot:CAMPEP_0180122394 /NCGR_PEP_ID=MMETSP0986-20121125/3550_1 /TAXON_ID=697907 /ORGANISM="non described non described, Strain CCMP2293" /LENGTH=50 /DNA_ID=CAMNT_0022061575 /DNA_START=232 /DNA_END=384 /DNA_ORIENTATION=-
MLANQYNLPIEKPNADRMRLCQTQSGKDVDHAEEHNEKEEFDNHHKEEDM